MTILKAIFRSNRAQNILEIWKTKLSGSWFCDPDFYLQKNIALVSEVVEKCWIFYHKAYGH